MPAMAVMTFSLNGERKRGREREGERDREWAREREGVKKGLERG